jgi:hypothetical protein
MEIQMQKFDVDDDVAELVARLAKKGAFETLSFNEALRRVFQGQLPSAKLEAEHIGLEDLVAQAATTTQQSPKKAPSPNPAEWVSSIPDLKARRGLHSWKAICDALKIDTAGDSARRRLKNWVKINRPSWPPVPDID